MIIDEPLRLTDEESFWKYIDENPDDTDGWLMAFHDWLDDRGDVRARVLAWAMKHGFRPAPPGGARPMYDPHDYLNRWNWYPKTREPWQQAGHVPDHSRIPDWAYFECIPGPLIYDRPSDAWRELTKFVSRQDRWLAKLD